MKCMHCTAETTNGLAICARCRQTLTVALVNVAAYHADVLRIRPGERVKVRSTYQSTPPPGSAPAYDPISETADAVASMIYTWCLALADDRPVGDIPADTTKRCGWLEHHIGSIATLEWAGELLRDCLAAERKLVRILDKADTGWYAGMCGASLEDERVHDGTSCLCACHNGAFQPCDIDGGCGSEYGSIIAAVTCERGLYATTGQSWIRCPECGKTHNVADRRKQMVDEARDEVAPVAVIARAVVGLLDTEVSVERLANRIDQWVHRGQLHDLGVRVLSGTKPQRVYRIGDVFDLLERNMRTKEAEAC